MKQKCLLLVLLFYATFTFSQCILTTGSYSQADVETCISNCGCSTILIEDGNTVTLSNDWDLTSLGDVVIQINGPTGQLVFPENGSSVATLTLTAGSSFNLIGPFDEPPLISTGNSQNEPRVVIGDDSYYGRCTGNKSCLDDLIALFLPVKMSYFIVKDSELGFARLEWETLSEEDNDGFVVIKNGSQVDFIEGNGNSQVPIKYGWTDPHFITEEANYQIIQYDTDGRIGYYSDILNFKKDISEIIVFPNPVDTELTLLLTESDLIIKIFDYQGQILKEKQGTEITIINMDDLASGFYLMLIEKEGSIIHSEKIIKN